MIINNEGRLMSEKVVVKTEVIFYDKEKPKMTGPIGQLILTDRRLVFIKPASQGLIARAPQDYSANIDEGLRNEGSLAIPLGQIIEAKSDSTWGTPYLRIRYRTESGEKACSFIFRGGSIASGGVYLGRDTIERLAGAIIQLKQEASTG
jgi:hypothetical protein